MAEIVGIQLQVDAGNTEQTVGSLRAQLREAQAEVFKVSEAFGATSTEAAAAAQKAAALKDEIGDALALTEAFNPDRKFQAFSAALNGVTGGFAAVQGAMALLGVESESVEKTLLKVQSAMALSQGLNSVLESRDAFKNLLTVLRQIPIVQRSTAAANTLAASTMRAFGVATTQTSVAFKVLRGAIIATGIGALVVVIGLAVEAFSNLASAADQAKDAQERYNNAVSDGYKNATNKLIEQYRREEAEDVARLKGRGATEEQIYKTQQHYADLRLNVLRNLNAQQKARGFESVESEKQIEDERSKAYIASQDRLGRLREEAAARSKAAEAKDDTAAKAKEAQRIQDMEAARQDRRQTDLEFFEDRLDFEEGIAQRRAELQQSTFDAESQRLETHLDNTLTKIDANAKATVAIAERERDARLQSAQIVANGLAALSDLAGEQTLAGKVLAVASAGVSTYLSAQQAYLSQFLPVPDVSSPIRGALAAGVAVVSGLANIRKILAIQIPGKGSGGASAPSAPSLPNANAPIAPQGPQIGQTVTQLDQSSINALNGPVKAYVVESEITGSQDRINRIHNAASFQ